MGILFFLCVSVVLGIELIIVVVVGVKYLGERGCEFFLLGSFF